MVVINHTARELTAKIVYYGPGLCGKTTNLEQIHRIINPNRRGQMMSLATETDRTLFFDLLPIDVGSINGFDVRLQLFTVPGQTYYNSTRSLVLRGSDGVVFVADSRKEQLQANIDSMKNLQENLEENNLDFATIPFVIQFNKQDCDPLIPEKELRSSLNHRGVECVKAVAMDGKGVAETLKIITKGVMVSLHKKLGQAVTAPAFSTTSKRSSAGAPIMVKTEKKHIPTVVPATKEQIKRETILAPKAKKPAPAQAKKPSPAQVADTKRAEEVTQFSITNGSLTEETAQAPFSIPDHQNAPTAQNMERVSNADMVNVITGIKSNLAQIVAINKRLGDQYGLLSSQLDFLASKIRIKPKP